VRHPRTTLLAALAGAAVLSGCATGTYYDDPYGYGYDSYGYYDSPVYYGYPGYVAPSVGLGLSWTDRDYRYHGRHDGWRGGDRGHWRGDGHRGDRGDRGHRDGRHDGRRHEGDGWRERSAQPIDRYPGPGRMPPPVDESMRG
jgi:hypothetical protein